jgi:hypothetical protein
MRTISGKTIRGILGFALLFALSLPLAAADFDLAKPVVEILSKGTFYVKYKKMKNITFDPATVYNKRPGMTVTYSEKQPNVRYVDRDDKIYTIDDKSKIMEIRSFGGKTPFTFEPRVYQFAGSGEETTDGKTYSYEDASYSDGDLILRLVFDDGKLDAIRLVQPDGENLYMFPAVMEFGSGALDLYRSADLRLFESGDGLFEIPKDYEVRKTLQQLKEDAKQGKMPDNPEDKIAVQLSLSEDERLERERADGKQSED